MPPIPKKTPPPLPIPLLTSERIVAYRKARGLSQDALAELMGISRKQVSDYELGRARPNDETIVRLAFALGVSSDILLGMDASSLANETPSLRITRRLRELEQLPEAKKKVILQLLDDLIRANT